MKHDEIPAFMVKTMEQVAAGLSLYGQKVGAARAPGSLTGVQNPDAMDFELNIEHFDEHNEYIDTHVVRFKAPWPTVIS